MITCLIRKRIQLITLASSLLLVCSAFGGSKLPYIPGSKTPVSVNINNIKWHKLSSGGEIAYLVSKPDKPGLFIILVKKLPGYTKAPHYHPSTAYITVLSGVYYRGHGNKFIKSKAMRVKKGSFFAGPPGYVHYEWSKNGAISEIVAMGPWKTIYVNEKGQPIGKPEYKSRHMTD